MGASDSGGDSWGSAGKEPNGKELCSRETDPTWEVKETRESSECNRKSGGERGKGPKGGGGRAPEGNGGRGGTGGGGGGGGGAEGLLFGCKLPSWEVAAFEG